MAYAVFPNEFTYHLASPNGFRTQCDLPTKGQRRKGAQRLPTARITTALPPPTHALCPRCLTQSSQAPSSAAEHTLPGRPGGHKESETNGAAGSYNP